MPVAIAETGAPVTVRALPIAARLNRRKERALHPAPRVRAAVSKPKREADPPLAPSVRAAVNRPVRLIGLQPAPEEAVTVPSGTSAPAGQLISNLSAVERVLVGEAHGWLLEVAAALAWVAEVSGEAVGDVAAADGAPM